MPDPSLDKFGVWSNVRSLGDDQRYEWRVVLRNHDGVVVDETSPTTSRDGVFASFVAMAQEYKQWPKEAVQLERRKIGEWETIDV